MLKAYDHIIEKLLRFTRKYYTKVLIKGILLFLALGFIFFFLTLAVEYFLWLNSTGRLILLILFLGIEGFLLVRFIIIPISYLFRIKKGISEKEASVIIGKHFKEVDDKLYNLLELAEDPQRTELLLASIEQRSSELRPIPFHRAVDYRDNLKYAKYLIIPIVIILLIVLSGNLRSFIGSYDRVVHFDVAYEPPAPFVFRVMSGELRVLETEEVTVQVATEGSAQPSEINIVINDRAHVMQKSGGVFHYTFSPPLSNSDFYFEANGIRSRNYRLEALEVPAIQDFTLKLNYPKYTGKRPDILNSTGNATFPEGTVVEWEINGKNTERINLISQDSTILFVKDSDLFRFSSAYYKDFNYQLTTSNANAEQYEKLSYKFKVIKDARPSIKAREYRDTINANIRYYEGEASDDYELANIKLVCYPVGREEAKQIVQLSSPNTNFEQFYYTFPSGLNIAEGESYEYYFEATDNDGIRGGKTAKSEVFSTRLLDSNELENNKLDTQKDLLEDLNRSLDNYKEQEEELDKINKDQKEKNSLSFNDQNKIRDFLKKQERQEEMMQKFSRQLKENIERDDERLNQLLKERLERQELEAQKNQKLLEELQKIADKLEKEELSKRLEELAKNQKSNERNLEQLLELTKRYYVTEKAAQLARELEELAKIQETLSKAELDSMTNRLQENMNRDFEELSKELDELKKDNENLKKPLPIKVDEDLKESVKEDQKEALSELNKQKGSEQADDNQEAEKSENNARKKQKSAAEKIQQLSDELKESSSMSGSGSTITEDAEMLRQILDNLITFSFKQENLFEELEESDLDLSYFSEVVREQKELKGLFEHVDDSLFALSLRRAELSEFVNEQINEVYYNMDKSVESIVEGRIYQGVSYQQYVLTAANSLADFLANILDNMQQSMQQGSGNGQGEDFQLPDIIKGQQELGEKMGQMKGKNNKGQEAGEEGQEKGQEGESGEEGKGEKGSKQGDSEGEGEGQNGQKKEGQGTSDGEGSDSDSEEDLEELYEIYKEQQRIRDMLEKQLEDMIRAGDRQLAQKLIQQMEDFENELLKSGITERTISKMNTIQHQLLKLENAALRQGKKDERKSTANIKEYNNPVTTKPEVLRNFKNDIEILNRQALPLHQIFQDKVKDYFNAKD